MRFMILFLLVIHTYFASAAVHEISESMLIDLSRKHAPSLDSIKATLLSQQTQLNLVEEKYAPEIFGKASYSETQERPIIEFLPVFSPIKQVQLGVKQNLGNGLEAQFAATTDQRSASSALSGSYNNVTTTVLSFTVQMDLWRNLLGRMSDTERENAHLDNKRAAIEQKLNTRAFEISLRKIYWALVANQEQLKISENLKVTANEQVSDARKRLQNSIGDAGEVARYEAQYATRSGQVIFLNYQREALIKQLKNLLPDMGLNEVKLASYDLTKTFNDVLACSAIILQNQSIPYNFTQYDEMMKLLKEVKANRKVINQRYSDMDLKLFGTVKSTGIGSDKKDDANYRGSYGLAFDDMNSNNRTGYETGVTLNIPLGDAKKNTQDTKTLYDEKRLLALIDQADAQVVSTHTQLAKSMKLISDVIETQKISSRALEKRLQVIRRKYTQARVSVNDLIQDQDALLRSEISTVDAQLQALNVLFDYLMIFTDTPCDFNRI